MVPLLYTFTDTDDWAVTICILNCMKFKSINSTCSISKFYYFLNEITSPSIFLKNRFYFWEFKTIMQRNFWQNSVKILTEKIAHVINWNRVRHYSRQDLLHLYKPRNHPHCGVRWFPSSSIKICTNRLSVYQYFHQHMYWRTISPWKFSVTIILTGCQSIKIGPVVIAMG